MPTSVYILFKDGKLVGKRSRNTQSVRIHKNRFKKKIVRSIFSRSFKSVYYIIVLTSENLIFYILYIRSAVFICRTHTRRPAARVFICSNKYWCRRAQTHCTCAYGAQQQRRLVWYICYAYVYVHAYKKVNERQRERATRALESQPARAALVQKSCERFTLLLHIYFYAIFFYILIEQFIWYCASKNVW